MGLHSFNKYLLTNMPSTILDAGDTLVNKTDKFSALKGLIVWWDLNPGQFHSKVLTFFHCDTKGLESQNGGKH